MGGSAKPRKTPRRQRPPVNLPGLLAEGLAYVEIAAQLGCDRETVSAWAASPEIAAAVAALQREALAESRGRLAGLRGTAIDALKGTAELSDPGAASARVRAAEAILDRSGLPKRAELEVSGGLEIELAEVPDPDLEREILQAAAEILAARGLLELAGRVRAA